MPARRRAVRIRRAASMPPWYPIGYQMRSGSAGDRGGGVDVEAEAARRGGGFAAVRHLELRQDVGDVDARGLRRDEQLFTDLAVGATGAEQTEHLALARGEAGTVGRRGRRDVDAEV